MKTVTLSAAYMPLVDAAPLIIAQEMGFAEAEGITLDLIAAPSWSSVRDMLAFGRVDAAHLLSPIPIAMALGLGGVRTPLSAVSVLSVNGDVIGVGKALESALRDTGHDFAFNDPVEAAAALVRAHPGPLVFGVPFPFSMHVELLRYWGEGTDLAAKGIELRTIPPPLMADALAAGDIDAFCVGEPWGSVAVDTGAGALLLPGKAIWAFSPEKVLAVRTDWAETEPELLGRLIRATWRAGRWVSLPESQAAATEILSRKGYLDVSPELIERALSGDLTVTQRGEQRRVTGFVGFHDGATNFPWRSQAKWIASRLQAAHGVPSAASVGDAATVFRTDLFRKHMAATEADMPGASEKLEGSLGHPTAVASSKGQMSLAPDSFFDGRIFDPRPKV